QIIEESQCWKERKLEISSSKARENGFCLKRGHSSPRNSRRSKTQKFQSSQDPFYWTKQLHKLENENSDRWRHDGFMEMHREDFADKKEQQQRHNEPQSQNIRNGSEALFYGPKLPPTLDSIERPPVGKTKRLSTIKNKES
uniref:Uncharacterized protein n=1 Tax=Romanomermis culicivorax TaxID=13658 RepID=A0A915J0R2_ROMCU